MEMIKRFEKYRGEGGNYRYRNISLTSDSQQYNISF
jgi:hypothetical protein